jgi:hypothetical protein
MNVDGGHVEKLMFFQGSNIHLYPFVTYLVALLCIINVTTESEYWELNNFLHPIKSLH